MREFLQGVRRLVIAICIALFAVGVIWNLFCSSLAEEDAAALAPADLDTVAQEKNYTAEKNQSGAQLDASAAAAAQASSRQTPPEEKEAETLVEDRIATLRMARDSSWQQLQDQLAALDTDQRETYLQQYATLRYKERRLEVLLQAKGLLHCLVLLEEKQANVIGDQDVLQQQYEKIFDLVQRNTDYGPEQIVLVPLESL